ncbi:uncharacterized protein LOC132200161 [Neocloeon triangulifer]|uniref:uncharacterized protein LOC132200161 n=1 Tax=Neocloeon triangulifer TaxID=2078957 RepID=UPI00286F99C3|nr:uncharacterized protein LOC132200161 [Neocloeon triangulifer]
MDAWLLGCLLCIFCSIGGIIGNGMTLCLFISDKKFRDPIGLFIMGLTITGLITSTTAIPLKASVFYTKATWTLGSFLCYVDKFLCYGSLPTSIMFISSIALNRWTKINCTAQTYNRIFTMLNTKLIILFNVAIGYSPIILGFFGITTDIRYEESGGICFLYVHTHTKVVSTAIFIASGIVVGFCYGRIYKKVKDHKRSSCMASSAQMSTSLTKMLMATAATFYLCFLPTGVSVILMTGSDLEVSGVHYIFFTVPYFSTVVLNPIIYGVLNRNYRNAYKEILERGLCLEQKNPTIISSNIQSTTGIMDALCRIAGLALCAVCSTTGIIGNGLTLCIFIFFKQFRDPIGILILGLTVSDFLTSIFSIPLNSVFFLDNGGWILGKTWCYVNRVSTFCSPVISIIFIACLAVNRLVKVTCAAETYSRIFTISNTILILISTTIIGHIPVVLAFFKITAEIQYDDEGICFLLIQEQSSVITMVLFGLASVIIILSYLTIYFRAKGVYKMTTADERSIQLMKMLLATTISFFICFAPAAILLALSGHYKSNFDISAVDHFLFQFPYYFSVVVNPVIYCVMNTNYRNAYKAILKKCCCFCLIKIDQ